VHLSLDRVHPKTVPSRQTTVSLTRLGSAGARPAGRPPSRAIALYRSAGGDEQASSVVVEVDRVVNASGLVGLAGRYVSVGQALAGRRITLRLDGDLAHVIDEGVLVRTLRRPRTCVTARCTPRQPGKASSTTSPAPGPNTGPGTRRR
jgi:hypothetical protein